MGKRERGRYEMKNIPLEMKIIGGVILLAIIYVWYRGIGGAAKDLASGTVAAAGGATAGAAEGIGSLFGVPLTNDQKCEAACAAGETWNASKFCSANRFLTYLKVGK